MKHFFFILSCFLLFLSCLPCGDSVECNVKTELKITATENHQQHDHAAEACTPFCTCSCCAASTFFSPFSKAQAIKEISPSQKHPLYNIALKGIAFCNIWQPPKTV